MRLDSDQTSNIGEILLSFTEATRGVENRPDFFLARLQICDKRE
jgi:hypothetical protein